MKIKDNNGADYPEWMRLGLPDDKFLWLPLMLDNEVVQVTRGKPDGKADRDDGYWKVERRAKGYVEDGKC